MRESKTEGTFSPSWTRQRSTDSETGPDSNGQYIQRSKLSQTKAAYIYERGVCVAVCVHMFAVGQRLR